jgi:hypothetical protein
VARAAPKRAVPKDLGNITLEIKIFANKECMICISKENKRKVIALKRTIK